MKVGHYREVDQAPVTMEGSSGCQVRWLLDEAQGAPNFAMRQYEVAPQGFTPLHSHGYEHEVFILEGSGIVVEGDTEHAL
jgi:quercetin dioxygenase-like cupin family protein